MEVNDIINLHRLNQARMAMQIGEEPQDAASTQDTGDAFYSFMMNALQDNREATTGSGTVPASGPSSRGTDDATSVPATISSLIAGAAQKYGIDAKLIYNVIKAESSFRSDAVSKSGAQGLMQLMPSTAATYGVKDAFDPVQNIDGGARLLKDLMNKYKGDVALVLAAYNAGVGAVAKYKGVPPFAETRNYVTKIVRAIGQN